MLKIIYVLIFSYVMLVLLLYFFQRHLIYFPSSLYITPKEANVPEMKEVLLTTTDGLTLKAWYHPPVTLQHPTLVYYHGNAGNISMRAFIVEPFIKDGFGVLLVTYRGYSGNPGKPTEEGLYEDGRTALKFLAKQNIMQQCTFLYGESIGSAVAIQMAVEHNVGGIVLQSPFTSLGEIGQFHYSIFPIKGLLHDQYNSILKAKNLHVPVLLLYGKYDEIVPPKFSLELFDAISSKKKIISFDLGHNEHYPPDAAINFMRGICK